MKKIKKIKIKVNGKKILINDKEKLSKILQDLKIPIKKVAIEINREIIIKKKLNSIKVKENDVVEIVHFIGGG
jgi:thiamine biosynthesis protein ThiS